MKGGLAKPVKTVQTTSIAKPGRHHGEGELDIAPEKDAASSKIIANCCHKPGRPGPRHWTDGEKDRDSG
ncbi:hypothetical protein CMUS01_07814 [Colletotrichum musicola]|uniref:Uncharacterized protein n=1 Tax=Colletotrichum musicola TaxID=2175873 RepID=A0A8H6KFC7_9PEZI|nr:hypothetical protein CMUS01_07814 [Colletotrichum musicola]